MSRQAPGVTRPLAPGHGRARLPGHLEHTSERITVKSLLLPLENRKSCDILWYIMANGLPKLREIREAQGMSQRRLAGLAGITQAALFRLETGETDPRLSTLRQIAKALGVTVGEIIGEGKPARKRARGMR